MAFKRTMRGHGRRSKTTIEQGAVGLNNADARHEKEEQPLPPKKFDREQPSKVLKGESGLVDKEDTETPPDDEGVEGEPGSIDTLDMPSSTGFSPADIRRKKRGGMSDKQAAMMKIGGGGDSFRTGPNNGKMPKRGGAY